MNFIPRWLMFNTVAMFAGYLMYTPIAHGVTGGHGLDLTAAQLIAHSFALAVVAIFVTSAQRHVLAPFVTLSWKRVQAAAIAFNIAFWVGYYQPVRIGPDTDMILGFLVLGSIGWLGALPIKRHRVAAAIAVISFPVGGVVGQVLLLISMALFDFTLDPRTNMVHHTLLWMTTGVAAGLLGGWASGVALSKMVPAQLGPCSGKPTQQQLTTKAAVPPG